MTGSAADDYADELPKLSDRPTILASSPHLMLTAYERLQTVPKPPASLLITPGGERNAPQSEEERQSIQLDGTLLGDEESPLRGVHLRAAYDCVSGEQEFALFIIPDGSIAGLAKILPQGSYIPLERATQGHAEAHRQLLQKNELLKDRVQINTRIADTKRFLGSAEATRLLGVPLVQRIKDIKRLCDNGLLKLPIKQQKQQLADIGIKPAPDEKSPPQPLKSSAFTLGR